MNDSQLLLSLGGYIRLSDILKVIPVCKSTWWAGVKKGRFPKPIKIGPRITAWRVEDIQGLVKSLNHPEIQ